MAHRPTFWDNRSVSGAQCSPSAAGLNPQAALWIANSHPNSEPGWPVSTARTRPRPRLRHRSCLLQLPSAARSSLSSSSTSAKRFTSTNSARSSAPALPTPASTEGPRIRPLPAPSRRRDPRAAHPRIRRAPRRPDQVLRLRRRQPRLELPFSGDWDTLVQLSCRWTSDTNFETLARASSSQKLELAAPALVKPYDPKAGEWLHEDYFIFHVKKFEARRHRHRAHGQRPALDSRRSNCAGRPR